MKKRAVKFRLLFALIAIVAFFIGLYFDNYLMRMISKPIPLFVLMSLIKPNTHYSRYIFIGLVFSVIGDFLLEASSSLFVFGLVSFLIAHINYIIAFTGRNKLYSFKIVPILLVYGIGLYWILFPSLKEMAIPVLLYLSVILVMVWRAFVQRRFDKFAIYALIGSLFFVFSDSLIALDKFYATIPYSRGVIMTTYWTSQFLIFISVFQSKKL